MPARMARMSMEMPTATPATLPGLFQKVGADVAEEGGTRAGAVIVVVGGGVSTSDPVRVAELIDEEVVVVGWTVEVASLPTRM
jgi:hypothetical protein